jgi:carbamoyl-phosphate synthase large subunit
MYNVGITGVGSLIGQGIIKCIRRSVCSHEYRLIGFDYFKDTVGSFWCDKNFILPDILKPGFFEFWLSALVKIIQDEKIHVLFIGVDFELPLFAKHKASIELATGCKVIVSSSDVIDIGNDKYKTYEFLKKNGLNYPATFLPGECDPDSLTYPVIVKPRVGARSIGVSKVDNKNKLEAALQLAKDPVIQECIGDDSTEYTCGIIALGQGQEKSIVLNRVLKQGNTYLSEYKNNFSQVIYEYIDAITKCLNPYGACNYQLRLDASQTPKLFEINPRHSGTTYMRSLFGYNEVLYILKKLLENKTLDFDLKEGKAIRFYEEDLIK